MAVTETARYFAKRVGTSRFRWLATARTPPGMNQPGEFWHAARQSLQSQLVTGKGAER